MELAINKKFEMGAWYFQNVELTHATANIMRNMQASKEAFVTAALELDRINAEKLFQDDFVEDGKPSFSLYCEEVLGIKKTVAYRMIQTAKMLLAPEMVTQERPEFFKTFSDTALGIMLPLKTYDNAKGFCETYAITETTSCAAIRKLVKEHLKKEKNSEEVETDTSDEEVETDTSDEEKAFEVQCLVYIAKMFKSALNEIFELFPEDKAFIKELIRKWGEDNED